MNAAQNNECATLLRKTRNGITSKGIPGVNADPHNIPGVNRLGIERFQSLVP
jgi:hypothetical protein